VFGWSEETGLVTVGTSRFTVATVKKPASRGPAEQGDG